MCRAVLGALSGVALLLVGFGLESLTGALLAGPILIVVIGFLCRDRRPQQFHRRFPVGVFTTARTTGFTPSG